MKLRVRHPCRVGGKRTCWERDFLKFIGWDEWGRLFQCRVCHSLVAEAELGAPAADGPDYLWETK